MRFLKENSYDIVRLYINQIGMTIFSLVLYFSVTSLGDNPDSAALYVKLKIGISIFAILFFFALLYTAAWDWGANDKIRIDSGKIKKNSAVSLGVAHTAHPVIRPRKGVQHGATACRLFQRTAPIARHKAVAFAVKQKDRYGSTGDGIKRRAFKQRKSAKDPCGGTDKKKSRLWGQMHHTDHALDDVGRGGIGAVGNNAAHRRGERLAACHQHRGAAH